MHVEVKPANEVLTAGVAIGSDTRAVTKPDPGDRLQQIGPIVDFGGDHPFGASVIRSKHRETELSVRARLRYQGGPAPIGKGQSSVNFSRKLDCQSYFLARARIAQGVGHDITYGRQSPLRTVGDSPSHQQRGPILAHNII